MDIGIFISFSFSSFSLTAGVSVGVCAGTGGLCQEKRQKSSGTQGNQCVCVCVCMHTMCVCVCNMCECVCVQYVCVCVCECVCIQYVCLCECVRVYVCFPAY